MNKKPLFVFYLLVGYVFLQFCWWTYLLIELNGEVYGYNTGKQVIIHSEEKLHQRWMMVTGEGLVFLSLLVLGVIKTRKAFKKEIDVARQQQNFILSVTHELKSPLASIKLYLQTLQRREIDKEQQGKFIGNAIEDTERLNRMVENILYATQIENDNNGFEKSYEAPVNFSAIVKDITMDIISRLEDKQKIKEHIQPEVFCQANEDSLSSIARNLIENAVKYAPGCSVLVDLREEQNQIVFRVMDEGPGIPEEEKIKIFDRFYRIGNEEVRKTKGTGLGLYLVKHIVHRYKGTLEVQDNTPCGSIFEVRFPIPDQVPGS